MQTWQSLVDGFRPRVGRKAIAALIPLQDFQDFQKEDEKCCRFLEGADSGVDVKIEGHHADLASMFWNVTSDKSRERANESFLVALH